MEDDHTTMDSIDGELQGYAIFGVYDGHCGDYASHYASQHLPKNILLQESFKTNLRDALKVAFLTTDADLLAGSFIDRKSSGNGKIGGRGHENC